MNKALFFFMISIILIENSFCMEKEEDKNSISFNMSYKNVTKTTYHDNGNKKEETMERECNSGGKSSGIKNLAEMMPCNPSSGGNSSSSGNSGGDGSCNIF